MFKDVLLTIPTTHFDSRGNLFELFREEKYETRFVQTICSRSEKGVLRGMHAQLGQSKLVTTLLGEIYSVVVDIRKNSPTEGKWCSYNLGDKKHEQLFIPEGFAHGFCVLSNTAIVIYELSSYQDTALEMAFRFDDRDVAIDWPIEYPSISLRDERALSFKEVLI